MDRNTGAVMRRRVCNTPAHNSNDRNANYIVQQKKYHTMRHIVANDARRRTGGDCTVDFQHHRLRVGMSEGLSKNEQKRRRKAELLAKKKAEKEAKKEASTDGAAQGGGKASAKQQLAMEAGLTGSDYVRYRTDMLSAMEEEGRKPFPHKFHVSTTIPQFRKDWGHLTTGQVVEEDKVSVAGRVMSHRASSQKLQFYDLHGDGEKIQLMANFRFFDDKDEVREGFLATPPPKRLRPEVHAVR